MPLPTATTSALASPIKMSDSRTWRDSAAVRGSSRPAAGPVATRRSSDGDTTLTVPPSKSVDQMLSPKATAAIPAGPGPIRAVEIRRHRRTRRLLTRRSQGRLVLTVLPALPRGRLVR